MFTQQVDWGSWVMGDLSDTVRRLSEVLGSAACHLGRSTEVVMVTASPPPTTSDLPLVAVLVGNEYAVERMRAIVTESEFQVRWLSSTVSNGWSAEVAGIHLTVASEAAA